MREETIEYNLELLKDSKSYLVNLVAYVRDWQEDGRRHRPCQVTLKWNEREIQKTSHNVYRAFQMLREELEAESVLVNCYGACNDVQASGMQCDMGDGTHAYRMSTAKENERPDVVNIFHTEPNLVIGTVKEQQNYFKNLAKKNA